MDKVVHRDVTIERHGQRWRFRIRVEGRLRRSSHSTLDEARAALDAILDRRAVEQSRKAVGRAGSVTIADLCREWLDRQTHLAPATRSCYEIHLRCHITPGIGSLDANLIRPLELEDFYGTRNYAAAQKSHIVLRGTFDWAIRNERLNRPSNPTHHVRPTRRMCADHDGYYGEDEDVRTVPDKAIPSPEEIKLIINDAKARGQRWWWLYLLLAAALGARPGEICALRRRDIDLREGTIRIEWTPDKVSKKLKRPKSPWSIRTLYPDPELLGLVAPYLPSDPEAFLFPSDPPVGRRRGSLLPCKNSRSIERKLNRQLRRLGMAHYTPHGFRHYVATHMLDEGRQPLQVGKFLGHRDDQMVRKLYGNHIVEDTQRTIGAAASRLALDLEDLIGGPPRPSPPATLRPPPPSGPHPEGDPPFGQVPPRDLGDEPPTIDLPESL